MALHRSVSLASFLVMVWFGCSPPGRPPVPCVPGASGGFGGGFGGIGFPFSAADEPRAYAGKAFDLDLTAQAITDCTPGWTVEGEVLDPQNRPVAARFTRRPFGNLASVTVRFTPETTGAYLVAARFEPTLARVQRVVRVGRDRIDDLPIIDALPFDSGACSSLFRTLIGAVVCQRGTSAVVVRGGAMVETFPNATANVVGNTVWLLTAQRLERRVDLGTGALALTGSIAADVRLAGGSFFDDDRAVVFDGVSLRGPLVWNGTTLVDERRLFRAGNGFLLGTRALSFDGVLMCDASADAGGCIPGGGVPVGVQGDVLWTANSAELGRGEVVQLEYRVRGQPPALTVAVPFAAVDALAFPVSGSQTPRFPTRASELLTIVLVDGDPIFERWSLATTFTRDFALVGKTSSSISWVRR